MEKCASLSSLHTSHLPWMIVENLRFHCFLFSVIFTCALVGSKEKALFS